MEVFRRVRDEIESKIKQFIAETAQTNDSQLPIG